MTDTTTAPEPVVEATAPEPVAEAAAAPETAVEAAAPETVAEAAAPEPAVDEIAQLRAEIEKQKQALEDAKKAPEPEPEPESDELAKLKAESERLRQELQTLRGDVEKSDQAAMTKARTDAFARLGVMPEYQDVIPSDIDPRTDEGARALETWLAKRPLLTRSRAPVPPEIDLEGYAPSVQRVLSGEKRNPLINKDSIKRMQAHAREFSR